MKVVKIEKLERIVPNGGSGTGYSEYVKFRVHFEDKTYKDVMISDWYNHDQWPQFVKKLNQSINFSVIYNWSEAYDMFMTALKLSRNE